MKENIECSNCESTDTIIIEYFDDGDDYIDVEVTCNQCNEISLHTICKEHAEVLGII